MSLLSSSLRVSSHPIYMSNTIGSSRESNPSSRICHLRSVPRRNVAEKFVFHEKYLANDKNQNGVEKYKMNFNQDCLHRDLHFASTISYFGLNSANKIGCNFRPGKD